MIRRRKFQVKPIIPNSSSISSSESVQNSSSIHNQSLNLTEVVDPNLQNDEITVKILPNTQLQVVTDENYHGEEDETESSASLLQLQIQHNPVIVTQTSSSESADPTSLLTKHESSSRTFKKEESENTKLDMNFNSKKFKMSDLIHWKPKVENSLRKKRNERKQKLLENIASSSTVDDEGIGETTRKSNERIGPRVRINECGEMVVDEESLVVVENPESTLWEKVNDDLIPNRLNSLSYRRKTRRSVFWSTIETDLFYEVLAAAGTDFGFMHEFIPSRSRVELKRKFNKEEKTNMRRINEVLSKPTLLDERFKQRVAKMLKEVEGNLDTDDKK